MAHLQLTDKERYQIEALKKEGYTLSKIARSLNRSPSTICRELERNSDHKGYRGSLAHDQESSGRVSQPRADLRTIETGTWSKDQS